MTPTCKAPEGHEIDFSLHCVFCGWSILDASKKDGGEVLNLLHKRFIRPRYHQEAWYWSVIDYLSNQPIPEFSLHKWECEQYFGLQIMQHYPLLRWECTHIQDYRDSFGVQVLATPTSKLLSLRYGYGILYRRNTFFPDFARELDKLMDLSKRYDFLEGWKKKAKPYNVDDFIQWVYKEWRRSPVAFRVDVHFEDMAPNPEEYILENVPWEELDTVPMALYTDIIPSTTVSGPTPRWKATLHWATAKELYFGLEKRIQEKITQGYFEHNISERYVRLHGWPQP